jgi:hypothetical protein
MRSTALAIRDEDDELPEANLTTQPTTSPLYAEDAQALYDVILRTSNKFLNNCKYMPIAFLQGETPSFSELAKIMKRIAAIVALLADDFDPMMGQKAHDYCELMIAMGVAIDGGNHTALKKLVAELERKPCT